MELKYCILGCLILALTSGAQGITVNFNGGNGGESYGSEASFQANDMDSVMSTALLGEGGLSQTITGSGDLKERHSVANGQGSFAEVGAKVIDADRFDYGYTLTPNNLDYVKATQSLDVGDATYIHAWSNAKNAKNYEASSDIEVREGGLRGYTSSAYANDHKVETSQDVKEEIDDAAYIRASNFV